MTQITTLVRYIRWSSLEQILLILRLEIAEHKKLNIVSGVATQRPNKDGQMSSEKKKKLNSELKVWLEFAWVRMEV
jgi:hypothetical protein